MARVYWRGLCCGQEQSAVLSFAEVKGRGADVLKQRCQRCGVYFDLRPVGNRYYNFPQAPTSRTPDLSAPSLGETLNLNAAGSVEARTLAPPAWARL